MKRLSLPILLSTMVGLLLSQTASDADAQGQTLVPNTQVVSRNTQVQLFTGILNVTSEQAAMPLTLKLSNGSFNGLKFAWVRIFLNHGAMRAGSSPTGRLIFDERRFTNSSTGTVDLTGQLIAGPNTLIFQGAGMPGSAVSYELVSGAPAPTGKGGKVALRLNSADPSDVSADGVFTIHGTGFDETPSNNKATIYNQPAAVQKASKTELEVKVPANVPPHSMTVDVTVNGVKSNALTISIMGPPELSSCSPDILQPGSSAQITGSNFSKIPNNNVVNVSLPLYDLNKKVQVTASTSNSITFIAPEFSEMSGRINKAVGAVGTISVTVNGVAAKNTLTVQARATAQ